MSLLRALVVLSILLAATAAGAEKVSIHKNYVVNTLLPERIAACPTIKITPSSLFAGKVSVYSAPESIQTFAEIDATSPHMTLSSADNGSASLFNPRDEEIRFVITAQETVHPAPTLEVECLNFVSSDLNGDGTFEFVNVDQDWDGDGTRWQTCDCGGGATPGYTADWICGTYATSATDDTAVDYSSDDGASNPAQCRFEGERIWDDITDDVTALNAYLGTGSEVYWPPGIYVQRGADPADSSSCWSSTDQDFTQTCAQDADGINQSGVVMQHDSMVFRGAGSDGNGESDLQRQGTYVVMDRGNRADHIAITGGTIVTPAFCMGYLRSGLPGTCGGSVADGGSAVGADILTSSYSGNCIDLYSSPTSAEQTSGNPDGLCDYDGATSDAEGNSLNHEILCVDDSAGYATAMEAGQYWMLTQDTRHGMLPRNIMRIESVGSACGLSNGGLEVTLGGVPWLSMQGETGWASEPPFGYYGSESVVAQEASRPGDLWGPLDPGRLKSNMLITGLTFQHQNYRGEGTCTGLQSACDEGPVLTVGPGLNHRIEGNAFVHMNTAFGSGGALNCEPGAVNTTISRNEFRYSTGASLIDVSSSVNVENNIFSDNIVGASLNSSGAEAASFMVRIQGGFYRFFSNRFERNFILDAYTAPYLEGIVELAGPVGEFYGNTMLSTPNTCVILTSGAQFISIHDNVFSCGDINNSTSNEIGYPIAIFPGALGIPIEAISIRSNQFLSGGRITNEASGTPADAMILIKNQVNTTAGEIGDMGIHITDNYARMAHSDGAFVSIRGQDDPDNSLVYLDGNVLSQGRVAGSQALGIGAGLFTLDTDANGSGLASCGNNLVEGAWTKALANQCAAAF